MKKNLSHKLWMSIVAGLIVCAPVFAQEQKPNPPESGNPGNQEQQTMTQGELAKFLVVKLGWSEFLPANFSVVDAVRILAENGIDPKGGWVASKPVELRDLAYILVDILDLEPEDPNDDQSVFDACVANGINFSTISSAIATAGSRLANPGLNPPSGPSLNDPTLRLPPGRPSDFTNPGNDPFPFTPPAMTPNRVR